MQNLGKIILLCSVAFQFLWSAGVEAVLANTEVVQGNMAQLRIVATGNRAAFPNIRQIGGSQVVGRHKGQSNSFSYVNGKSESKHTTVLTLTFAPQQDMTIPAYSVNIDGTTYKTKPIKLKVVKSNAPKVANSDKFSLVMRADKKQVIVGESLVATVYFSLKNGTQLSEQPQYTQPQFKGFFVKEVAQQKNYRKGDRQVSELKYILTPKSEGNYTVDPATAKVGVSDTSKRDMFGRFFGTVWTPVVSNKINIEVKAQPEDTDLVGSFSIKHNLDKQNVKANKPVNLTLKIEGSGSLEDFEFLEYEIDGVTIFSDDSKVNTQIVGTKLQSNYVKKFVFISDHAFTIPARSISVYDTKKAKIVHLKIPAYDVKVEGQKAITTVSHTPNKGVVQTNLNQGDTVPKAKVSEKIVEVKSVDWWMLLLSFVLGLFVMYLFKFIPSYKRKKNPFKESEALKILYAHINESKEVEEMVRKLYARKNGDKNIQIDKKILREMVERFR